MNQTIAIQNGLIAVQAPAGGRYAFSKVMLSTIVANFAYYGYAPSKEVYGALEALNKEELINFWKEVEPILSLISGASRRMERFVVYKNFPQEVLDMSQSEYWTKQILMYWGFDKELFTQEERERGSVFEKLSPKVLHLATIKKYGDIYVALQNKPTAWTDDELKSFKHFVFVDGLSFVSTDVKFKENLIQILKIFVEKGVKVKLSSAMDILRLATALSGGDISFEKNTKFISFKRSVRRQLLEMLENASNLEEDVARDRERWKRFLTTLHPREYGKRFPGVTLIHAQLYQDAVRSFNSFVEENIANKNDGALTDLSNRPGDFFRRFHQLYSIYGLDAVATLEHVVAKELSILQLLKLKKYVLTANDRKTFAVSPKSNWSKIQILKNEKVPFRKNHLSRIVSILEGEIEHKLTAQHGFTSVNLDPRTANVKIPTGKAKLSPYTRGTVFPFGDHIKFIRAASYWKNTSLAWFDCGINFFDANWSPRSTICWNNTSVKGALFSGDPVNTKEMQGRACQMIDLDIEKLVANGVRYAVWNILCFSRIPFNKAEDMFASFQLGEDATSGKLFEPSRCQLAFPINDETFAKYVAYVDLVERKIVYLDASLKANVSSAAYNETTLSQQMPAFVEYLNAIPSVYDLFSSLENSSNGTKILYSDDEIKPTGGKDAYVFKRVNAASKFSQIDINKILA
jgi:hypothetical protein